MLTCTLCDSESGEAAPPKEEEEAKEMTLDEWKALQDQKRMKASFNIRKAGEGVDSNQWKKGVAYTKKKEEEEEEEESEEEEVHFFYLLLTVLCSKGREIFPV